MTCISVNQVSNREPLGVQEIAMLRIRSPIRSHPSLYLFTHLLNMHSFSKAFTVLVGPGPQISIRHEQQDAQHPLRTGVEGIRLMQTLVIPQGRAYCQGAKNQQSKRRAWLTVRKAARGARQPHKGGHP